MRILLNSCSNSNLSWDKGSNKESCKEMGYLRWIQKQILQLKPTLKEDRTNIRRCRTIKEHLAVWIWFRRKYSKPSTLKLFNLARSSTKEPIKHNNKPLDLMESVLVEASRSKEVGQLDLLRTSLEMLTPWAWTTLLPSTTPLSSKTKAHQARITLRSSDLITSQLAKGSITSSKQVMLNNKASH